MEDMDMNTHLVACTWWTSGNRFLVLLNTVHDACSARI